MISNTSRYADSTLVTINKNGISVQTITPSSPETYTFNYIYYILKGTERIDTVSYAFYGDATLWWKIADANPEILNWSALPGGTIIRIPNA